MEEFAEDYLTGEELIECRKDHEWEERRGFDFIVCRRCGLKTRTDLHAHASRHGYKGVDDYRAEYPKAPWVPRCIDGYRRKYAKKRYAREKAELQDNAAQLAEAERRVANLRQELEKQEAIVEKIQGKLGRPRTREDDMSKYGPRVTKLHSEGKSWPTIARIMKAETGQGGTESRWRLLFRHLTRLAPRTPL
jgi:hypothetical protein